MAVALSFNYHEAKVLLNWYENAITKGERFGASRYSFPQEEILIEKLKNPMLHSNYDPMDIEIMLGWKEKSLGPGIGEDKFYFPLEEEIYNKLKRAREQSKQSVKKERSINEKKLKNEKEKQINSRQQLLQDRIKAKKKKLEGEKISERIKSHLQKLIYFAGKKPTK